MIENQQIVFVVRIDVWMQLHVLFLHIYIYVHLFIVFCVEMLIISCVIFPLKHTP